MSVVVSTVLTVLTAVSAAGDQTPPPDDLVTPGVVGFFAIFAVAVATVFLGLDMVRRIRRTTYREQIRERLEAEAAERAAGTTPDAATTSPIDHDGSAEK